MLLRAIDANWFSGFYDRSLPCRFDTATLGIDCGEQSSFVGCPSQTMLVMSLSSISIKIIIENLFSIRFPRDYVTVCFHRAGSWLLLLSNQQRFSTCLPVGNERCQGYSNAFWLKNLQTRYDEVDIDQLLQPECRFIVVRTSQKCLIIVVCNVGFCWFIEVLLSTPTILATNETICV